MVDPDSDLVRKAKAGSKNDFGILVNRYFDMVYAVCFGVLRNREQARDASQEAFLKAWRDLPNFAEQAKFKTWLYRIAVNSSIDITRQRKPVDSIDATDVSDDDDRPALVIPDKSQGPRDKTHQADLRRLLDKAIAQLSPEHRAVVTLREWEELSYEEIAETLDIQMGTVMSRLFYARKKLAEILGGVLKEEKHV